MKRGGKMAGLAKKIQEWRKEQRVTQESLAGQLGVRQGAVAMWETGARRPKIETLMKMSILFGCSIDELLK